MTWTAELVTERIAEAMRTLARLKGEWPAGYRSSMPEPVRTERDAWLAEQGLVETPLESSIAMIAARPEAGK